MVLATVVWACVCLLAAPLPYNRRFWVTSRWNVFVIWCARVICGIRYQVKGYENLPDAPAILLSKHQSAWETIFLLPNMRRPLVFVFKKEILYIPFFGWAMARMDMIHIDRSKRTEAWNKVAEQGQRLFGQGIWVIMFPEGTRTPRGGQGVYKSGATRLAVTTGVPIVPIAVSSAKCWPRKSFLLRPGVIDVSIGPPIAAEGREPDELMREVERWIEAEMRRLDPEAYR
jgi:1-acyl-sn-glycerol-3-phosphate acyltransferase